MTFVNSFHLNESLMDIISVESHVPNMAAEGGLATSTAGKSTDFGRFLSIPGRGNHF